MAIDRDITTRKILEDKLKEASITDELTGILNRRGFYAFAQKQLEIAERKKRRLSVLYVDINNMKEINDELGHNQGDRALIDIANILKDSFRASDIIARFGGDEFIILITEPRPSTVERVITHSIEERIRVYNEVKNRPYTLSVSMGISHYNPDNPDSLNDIVCRADELMYENKQRHLLQKEGILLPKKNKSEKRVDLRFRIDGKFEAELSIPDEVIVRNISQSGICMRTSKKLPKNNIYKIRVRSDGEENILPKGMVIWSTQRERDPRDDSIGLYYESGLEFIESNDSSRKFLERLLRGMTR